MNDRFWFFRTWKQLFKIKHMRVDLYCSNRTLRVNVITTNLKATNVVPGWVSWLRFLRSDHFLYLYLYLSLSLSLSISLSLYLILKESPYQILFWIIIKIFSHPMYLLRKHKGGKQLNIFEEQKQSYYCTGKESFSWS